jgi:hypothetical protein
LKKTGLSNEDAEYKLQEGSRIHVQKRRRLFNLLAKIPVVISFTGVRALQDVPAAGPVVEK